VVCGAASIGLRSATTRRGAFCRLRGILRTGATALFFFSPVLLGATVLLKEELFDEHTDQVKEVAHSPLTVAGATCPAGTPAWNEQTGSVFDRHLLSGRHMRRTSGEIHIRPVTHRHFIC
jgi:hypothetical protein